MFDQNHNDTITSHTAYPLVTSCHRILVHHVLTCPILMLILKMANSNFKYLATYPCIWLYQCLDSQVVPCSQKYWHSSTTPVPQIGRCLKPPGPSRCLTVAVINRMLLKDSTEMIPQNGEKKNQTVMTLLVSINAVQQF